MELIGYVAICQVTGKIEGSVYLDKREAEEHLLPMQRLKTVIIKGFETNDK